MSLQPTSEETVAAIKEWAYSNDPEPQQDFDLLITSFGHEKLFIELTIDQSCPKRTYFLGCLYLFVGDAVRTSYQTNCKLEVDTLLTYAREISDKDIREWVQRSEELIESPSTFDYDLWCAGGFATASDNQPMQRTASGRH